MSDPARITRWDRLSPNTHPTPAETQDQAQEVLDRGRAKDAAEALRRGEQVHREIEIALGMRHSLRELLKQLEDTHTGHTGLQWFPDTAALINRHTGMAWYPGKKKPPAWVPQSLVDAWYREANKEALATLLEDSRKPAFDEPEGECRKSAESASKPRLELVPYDCIEEIAQVLTYGANKYEANNWTRGARWGRYFAALLRHAFAWWRGEDKDPETGYSHLAHVGCNLLFLMSYQRHGWGEDDRFLGPDDKPFIKYDGATDAA